MFWSSKKINSILVLLWRSVTIFPSQLDKKIYIPPVLFCKTIIINLSSLLLPVWRIKMSHSSLLTSTSYIACDVQNKNPETKSLARLGPCLHWLWSVIKWSDWPEVGLLASPITGANSGLAVLGRRTSCCVGEHRPPRPGTMGVAQCSW